MPFSRLGLHETLVRGVQAMGYKEPSPIQLQAIPLALQGQDLLGCAQTGSGKTAAFALPVLHRLLSEPKPGLRVLVLVPTRELAAQVETTFRDCSRFNPIRTAVVIGGVGLFMQKRAVQEGAQVVVATPGRLLDHLKQGNFKLDQVEFLILDEADRMLDMGFLPDIRQIISRVPAKRQTLLFSATLAPEVEQIAAFAQRHPKKIQVAPPATVAGGINQIVYPVSSMQKTQFLLALLKVTQLKSVLIFTRTKHGADRLARKLSNAGLKPGILHGDRSQGQRTQTMERFRDGKMQMLVATDIAARGIDVKEISHVINYDVPRHAEDYVHRVGRTGRAYAVGDAITLMDPMEEEFLQAIEKFIKTRFSRALLPGFPYGEAPRLQPTPQQPFKPRTFLDKIKERQQRQGGHGQRNDSRPQRGYDNRGVSGQGGQPSGQGGQGGGQAPAHRKPFPNRGHRRLT